MGATSFQNADKIVDRFLNLLANAKDNNGKLKPITPVTGSKAEDNLLSMSNLLEISKNISCANADSRLLAMAGGMYDLAAKILSVENQLEFTKFYDHLNLIANIKVNTSIVQASPGCPTDDTHRKITELYLGCLAIHAGHNVELDSPTNSNGKNPDILFDIIFDEHSCTQRWALAIKTISSNKGQTIYENIKKGGAQIEQSEAVRGMVVINVQDAIDHDSLWSQIFLNEELAKKALKDQIESLANLPKLDRLIDDWNCIFEDNKTSPVVLYMGHAVVKIKDCEHGSHIPMVMKMLYADLPTTKNDDVAMNIAENLNHYMQIILNGIPGNADYQPC